MYRQYNYTVQLNFIPTGNVRLSSHSRSRQRSTKCYDVLNFMNFRVADENDINKRLIRLIHYTNTLVYRTDGPPDYLSGTPWCPEWSIWIKRYFAWGRIFSWLSIYVVHDIRLCLHWGMKWMLQSPSESEILEMINKTYFVISDEYVVH